MAKSPEELKKKALARIGQWVGSRTLDAGTEHPGQFHLEKVIGFGGMGAVYRAFDYSLGRYVALKIVDPEGLSEYESRFKREARSMAGIRSDHIVDVYTFGKHGSELFLAMEILEGEDLESRLDRGFGEENFSEACSIAMEFLYGLEEAHVHGVIHRDIKPSNVFLARKGTKVTVKLLDFGIARMPQAEGNATFLTQEGTFFGTPQYMAPEQMRGMKGLGPRTDQFSAGAVLFEMLSGKIPYGRGSEDADWTAIIYFHGIEMVGGFEPYRSDLPAWLLEKYPQVADALARMLDPDPDRRYPDLMEPVRIFAQICGRVAPEPPIPSVFAEMTRIQPAAVIGSRDITVDEGGQQRSKPNKQATLLTPKPVTTPKVRGVVHNRNSSFKTLALGGAGLVIGLFATVIYLSAPRPNARAGSDAAAQPSAPSRRATPTMSHDAAVALAVVDASIASDAVISADVTVAADQSSSEEPVSEDAGRSGRRRERSSRHQPETPDQRAARSARRELERQCCQGIALPSSLGVAACPPAPGSRDWRAFRCGHH